MKQPAGSTVADYLASLPPDRRAAVAKVRAVIRKNLPRGFTEGRTYGMISYEVPLSRFPATYNGQPLCLAGIAVQKNYISLYLMTAYGDPGLLQELKDGFKVAGKKLDMGKSCIHFTSADDLPLDVIGRIIGRVSVDDYVALAERARSGRDRKAKRA